MKLALALVAGFVLGYLGCITFVEVDAAQADVCQDLVQDILSDDNITRFEVTLIKEDCQ